MAERVPRIEVVDEEYARFLRPLSINNRLEMVFDMWDFARQMVRMGLRDAHPDWDDRTIDREVSKRMIDASS